MQTQRIPKEILYRNMSKTKADIALKELAGWVRSRKIGIDLNHSNHVISARLDFNRAVEDIAKEIEKVTE